MIAPQCLTVAPEPPARAAQALARAGHRSATHFPVQSKLAVEGASRLLGREIDPKTHAELLDKLAAEVARG